MIYGIGVDMASISRIKKACAKPSFLNKVYSEKERQEFGDKGDKLAANFAAKEAFSKALGTGIRGFKLAEVSVLRDDLGKPYYEFSGKALEIVAAKGLKSHLSLTDEGDSVVAMAVLETQ